MVETASALASASCAAMSERSGDAGAAAFLRAAVRRGAAGFLATGFFATGLRAGGFLGLAAFFAGLRAAALVFVLLRGEVFFAAGFLAAVFLAGFFRFVVLPVAAG